MTKTGALPYNQQQLRDERARRAAILLEEKCRLVQGMKGPRTSSPVSGRCEWSNAGRAARYSRASGRYVSKRSGTADVQTSVFEVSRAEVF